MTNGKRDYKKEEAKYEKKHPKRNADRAARNRARNAAGLKVGDPRHADHKKPLTEGGSYSKSNVQILSAKANLQKEANRKKRKAGK
jgi:hypothetical protein